MTLSKSHLKELKELTQKKHREEQEKFVIEGIRLVHEALDSDFEFIEVLHTPELEEHPGGKALLQALKGRVDGLRPVAQRDIEAITDTVTAQGIAAVLRQQRHEADDMLVRDERTSVLVAFDAVSDPGNAGTMIRTCDWFGVNGVLLGVNSVELYNPKVIRATMGGVFHLPVAEDVDLLSFTTRARAAGYTVYVTDTGGETHFDRVNFPAKSLIIFGNEAWGVCDQLKALADYRVMIRRYGAAESLNVSVACGVVLSSLHKLYDE
jgi:TrmH family RNA methyltransferase